jgi:hypothetical protein
MVVSCKADVLEYVVLVNAQLLLRPRVRRRFMRRVIWWFTSFRSMVVSRYVLECAVVASRHLGAMQAAGEAALHATNHDRFPSFRGGGVR